jgi:hypothetical protein
VTLRSPINVCRAKYYINKFLINKLHQFLDIKPTLNFPSSGCVGTWRLTERHNKFFIWRDIVRLPSLKRAQLINHNGISNNVDSTWALGAAGTATNELSFSSLFSLSLISEKLDKGFSTFLFLFLVYVSMCIFLPQKTITVLFTYQVNVCSYRIIYTAGIFLSWFIWHLRVSKSKSSGFVISEPTQGSLRERTGWPSMETCICYRLPVLQEIF